MKATLIYGYRPWHSPKITSVAHSVFETESPATVYESLDKVVIDISGKDEATITPFYVHIDGILFELTEKPAVPVLADVMTGIEI